MFTTRAAFQGLRSSSGTLARQLQATARKPYSSGPLQHFTKDLPAKRVYQDSFPCTLHYYSWRGPTMALHTMDPDNVVPDEKENLHGQDFVRAQDDGLIHPIPKHNDPVRNGAMMMPHATFLLEILRNWLDWYEERKSMGYDLPEPYLFTVPKGTKIPSTLLLAYEGDEIFYLLPRSGMSLSALNQELNSLFNSHGCSKLASPEWFKKYDLVEGYNTWKEEDWMSK